ncbi:hypothetical protein BSLA_01r0738 [Burkholderia stabilis]|nr:hypothetical protein BSLA_01r0738 [Burkholderia stabilis]
MPTLFIVVGGRRRDAAGRLPEAGLTRHGADGRTTRGTARRRAAVACQRQVRGNFCLT